MHLIDSTVYGFVRLFERRMGIYHDMQYLYIYMGSHIS